MVSSSYRFIAYFTLLVILNYFDGDQVPLANYSAAG